MRTIKMITEFLDSKTPTQDTRIQVQLSGDISNETAIELIEETAVAMTQSMSRLLGCPNEPSAEALHEVA